MLTGIFRKNKGKRTAHESEGRSLSDRSRDLVSITIKFDPKLTSVLTDEHAAIHLILDEVLVLNKQGKYLDARDHLTRFTTLFVMHITKKQARLYTFLELEFKEADSIGPAIRAYRSKMNLVNREVRGFLTTWTSMDVATSNQDFTLAVLRIKKTLSYSNGQEEREVFTYYDNHKEMIENGMKNAHVLNIANSNSENLFSEMDISEGGSISMHEEVSLKSLASLELSLNG
ncbi:MAG: hypothetical protein RPS47_03730 [Colwellia sp.]